ncbi:acyl-CoA synthetase (NDP forming) [Nocardioides marinisabuli]|uniref:Acyl-CoA synthetase (NDP forming) n=1 Tax=Nocardioides marinisabuli TaxID=419476 RepID=A0A7Y9F153_9ACTN|nr:acetate--CoA ligase family protein [Nocardioides marinisabuli]NYD57603.1 acyl-CoA synthetase (NDP forming) [Nocardioides marinisabuli]
MTVRAAHTLYDARHVAIVGASADPAKWGYWLSRGALSSDLRVSLVNRRTPPVLGRETVASLAELADTPELVVLATPPAHFEASLDEALGAGARAVVAITADVFDDAVHRERVVRRVREAGAVLLGPNCMGLSDTARGLHLIWGELPPGPIGLVSQSGNLALEIGELAQGAGLGISRFASVGDQADLRAHDLVPAVAAGEQTKVVAMYVEDVGDGDAFGQCLAEVSAAGTPVVVLAAGGSTAGARAAASHTGSMVSGDMVMDAVCRAAGAVRVHSPGELVDVCSLLVADAARRPLGRRVGVIADGGGHGIVASDAAERYGFEVPAFGEELQERLEKHMPSRASAANPVDMAGGERELVTFSRLVADCADSGEVDSILVSGYLGAYGRDSAERAQEELRTCAEIADTVARTGVPVLVHSLAADSDSSADLRRRGVPVFARVEQATQALARVAGRRPAAWPARVARDTVADTDAYTAARGLLVDHGVTFPEARAVDTAEQAVEAAEQIGHPVVVKILGVDHKTEVGGVGLDLRTADEVHAFSDDLLHRLPRHRLSVEQMVDLGAGTELIVGVRQDPRFGTVVLVGAGGVQAEILEDRVIGLGPVDEAGARDLLRRLSIAPLFDGFRGRPALDLAAAAHLVAALSQAADAVRDEVSELEVNPVLVTPTGAVALDAHLVRGGHRG